MVSTHDNSVSQASSNKRVVDPTVSSIHLLAREATMQLKQPTGPSIGAQEKQLFSQSEFTVEEEVGAGGMGTIFRAQQKELQRAVAIKQLHPHLVEVDRIREGFYNEAVITGKLAHPNVVPVYGLSKSSRSLSMTMKLVSGCTLEDIICPLTSLQKTDAAKFTVDDCIEILIAICNPVAFAHSQGIIHRDIKPGNIMVGEFGEILLLDWGLATSVSADPDSNAGLGIPHVSQISGPEGTWSYMAPEMMDGVGDALGIHSDIYLLGACLYFILAQTPPHRHRHAKQFVTAQERDSFAPLPVTVDSELRRICSQAMAKHPADRHPTAKAFQDDLKNYLKHQKSRQIAQQADQQFAAATAHYSPRLNETERVSLFYELAESLAAYRQALALWEGNAEAKRDLQKASLAAAQMVFDAGELNSALVYLRDVQGPAAAAMRSQVQVAQKESQKAHRAIGHLRLAAIVVAGLLAASAISAFLVYHFMENAAEKVAETARKSLVANGKRELQQVVGNAATAMKFQKQTIATAANHFVGSFLQAYRTLQDNPSPSMTPEQPLQFVVSPRHSGLSRDPSSPSSTKKVATNTMVTFDGFTFHEAAHLKSTTPPMELLALRHIEPQIRQLYQDNQNLVIRYFMGFSNSHSLADYPGSPLSVSHTDPTVTGWFQRGIQTQSVYFTPPYRDEVSGRILLSGVLPVKTIDNEILGVAGVDIYISDLLEPLKLSPTWAGGCKVEIARFLGTEVDIVFTTRYEDMAAEVDSASWVPRERISNLPKATLAQMKKDLAAGNEGVISMEHGGRPVLWGYAPLGIQNAFALITVDQQTLTREADQIRDTILARNTAALILLGKVVGMIFGALLLLSLLIAAPLLRRHRARQHTR